MRKKSFKAQNTSCTPKTTIQELWDSCNMHNIEERIQYFTLIQMFQQQTHFSTSVPEIASNFVSKEHTRSSRLEGSFEIIKHNTEWFKNSFIYRGIKQWNEFIQDTNHKGLKTFDEFKCTINLWVTRNR
jgi:hypothetical protein